MTSKVPSFSVDLSGDVAIVTGAAAGLGRQFARTLASAGAKVAILDRRSDRLSSLREEIVAKGGQALALEMDVRETHGIAEVFNQVEATLGIANILINNAGITDAMPAVEASIELVDSVINTNFRAPLLLSCEFARRLIAINKRGGRIVNMSSAAAVHYHARTTLPIYSSTKAGLSRLTEVLAMDWAKYGINVNAIAPGLFHSEMVDQYLDVVGDALVKSFERQRVGTGVDLESTLLYLVSPSSSFVTGTIIRVDDAQLPR